MASEREIKNALGAVGELNATIERYSESLGEMSSSAVSAFTEMEASFSRVSLSLNSVPYAFELEVENVKDLFAEIPVALQSHRTETQARFSELEQDIIDYYNRVRGIQASYTADSVAYDKLMFDAKADYAAKSFGSMSNFFENLYVMTGSKNEELFNIMKTFAVAEATIQGYRAAVGAYAFGAEIGGPVLGAAFAASAIAATGAQIANILATEPGSTTSISSSGEAVTSTYEGGSTEAYPTTETTPTQNITIQIYNPLSSQNWADIVENDIIPALNDASDRNINITIGTA